MQALNFPQYDFRIRSGIHNAEIFDDVRKKFVKLTPEEWVRQHIVRFLIVERAIPAGRIKIEMPLKIQKLSRRADVVVFDDLAKPILIVECKSSDVKITQDVFEQISCYNKTLHAKYLLVTNGLTNLCCKIDFETNSFFFEKQIPDYLTMKLAH